ncbi:MAG: shikimate kinase [Desulfobacteraceae bacterium]|nr:shikimate kinase [Desulfobacteraceae bacterium]
MKIFLIGYRCTGKSTTGKILSDLLGCPFLDTDVQIETRAGQSISQIVQNHGWKTFRTQEKAVLLELKQRDNLVVATGGGIILDPESRTFLKENGYCIWLWATPDTVMQRIQMDEKLKANRPALTVQDLEKETRSMMDLREPYYTQLSQLKIDTGVNSPQATSKIIQRRLSNVG